MIVNKPTVYPDLYKGDNGREIHNYRSPRKAFRFISTQKERVEEAELRNSILESSPNEKTLTMATDEMTMNLRPRQEDKEIHY